MWGRSGGTNGRHAMKVGGAPNGTTARGYGTAHQKARRLAMLNFVPGRTPCARCYKPMTHADAPELDHDPTDPNHERYLGLSCKSCNRTAKRGRAVTFEEPTSEHGFHDRDGRWTPTTCDW